MQWSEVTGFQGVALCNGATVSIPLVVWLLQLKQLGLLMHVCLLDNNFCVLRLLNSTIAQ